MPQSSSDVQVLTPTWSPRDPAVHQECSGPAEQPGTLLLLRHPTHPFVATVPEQGNDLQLLLCEVANRYLARIPLLAGLNLSTDLSAAEAAQEFGWLPLTWGDPRQAQGLDPRRSFWVQRHVKEAPEEGPKRIDRTAVLLAAHRFFTHGAFAAHGDAVGLRVVLHVAEPDREGRSLVRVTGLATSALATLLAPRAAPPQVVGGAAPLDPRAVLALLERSELREVLLTTAKNLFRFDLAPAVQGISVIEGLVPELVLRGMGQRGPVRDRRVYAWTARFETGGVGQLVLKSIVEQRSHANHEVGPNDVLARSTLMTGTPLSASSHTRPAAPIDDFRRVTTKLPLPNPGLVPDGMRLLADVRVEVLPSAIGNAQVADDPAPLAVPDEALPLRSDDLAAAHAYVRAQELLQRFDAYGLAADSYFKMARLPLRMQPRAMFRYASNGETVNAQVSPDAQGQSLHEAFVASARPRLRVAFGSANLSHRDMLANRAGDTRAQPLGLAADRRWAWHEFGHVLNFASTGELEFRFAHSAGDALAAIVADPDTAADVPEHLRRLTFPWALLRRSHMRPADLGWCWCGRRSRLRLAHLVDAPPIPGGYFEEQLMSSSLFRLYQVIGGDGRNADERRRAASDYVVYLVMRAIALLGPADVVPARSADAFVSALTDADIGTAAWNVVPTWPEDMLPRPTLQRQGGAVHKVVRWAFEQQGLFATEDTQAAVEGVGLPPRVDVYIPGRGGRATGGYAAVPLAWDGVADMPWHVDAAGIFPNGGQLLRVVVRNRGREVAQGVKARAWWSPTGAVPHWQELDAAAAGPSAVGPDTLSEFAFEARDTQQQPLRGRCFVLAEVSCEADRANLDPDSRLPCSAGEPPADTDLLTDLVANDNNLGLRIVDFG